jgi:DNA-binding response OmpR family regulator
MESLIDRSKDGGARRAPQTAVAEDPEVVLRESRQAFVTTFASQCDRIAARAEAGADGSASTEEAIAWLHRMAGLGGTLGFGQVSAKAAELETALRAATLPPADLHRGLAAMRSAFAADVAAPVKTAAPAEQVATLAVLLVEDEPVQRQIMTAQLRQLGHRVSAVERGEDVLAAARETTPDLILLDVELPGIDGYAVCRMLKADPALAAIPVAFLSAHGSIDHRVTGLANGAEDFLTKPIDPRELTLRLQLMTRRGRRQEPAAVYSVLSYDGFCDQARGELQRDRAAFALIRTPAGRVADVAAFARDEIRRRDLCGEWDRSHVALLLPDTSGPAACARVASIVEKYRADGVTGVYAGVAAASTAASRTLEELVEEADEALAVARYENQAAARKSDEPRRDAAGQVDHPLVLVADDDPDVVRILDSHLAAGGYRRMLTFDGVRALEEIRAQTPDVLVLDLMMPRMTGFDVLAGIRDVEPRPRVIVLSARGREEDVVRAFGLGADDFIAKPFNPQELLARIARLVK